MDREPVYQIKVRGRLDHSWAEWFSGMAISSEDGPDGTTTILTGSIADQAALRGTLERIWNLNLTLISLNLVKPAQHGEVTFRPGWDL
jgi:hypothetical protein